MWGVIIGASAVVAFLTIVVKESLTSTAAKVQNGDSVFVPMSAIVPNNTADQAAFNVFTASLQGVTTKVTNVTIDPTAKTTATGSLIGLSPPVRFPLAMVTKIERNGVQFT